MNEIKQVQCLYFSPTGNTRKIVETISMGIGLEVAKPIDLTHSDQREMLGSTIESGLLIVGVPVHAGSYPSLLYPYLNKLDGVGRWVVPIAVCGNAQMRTCLADLSGLLKKRGFKILAAANFVGQHAFSTKELPLGKGRPDRRDLKIAYSFGKEIIAKMRSSPTDISAIRSGNLYLRVYLTGSVESQGSTFPAALHSVIRVSEYDQKRCDRCQSCVNSCPTDAIDAKTLQINDAACIRCFACTMACPHNLRGKIVNPDSELREWLMNQGLVRAFPQIFL